MRTTVNVDTPLGPPYRLSLDEYHRLIEAGAIDEDARLELIDGLLLELSPKTREHENAIAFLGEWLARRLDLDRFQLRVASALTLPSTRSEPEPDLFVFERDAPRPYHPGTAALVIEVSVSSITRDLRVKPRLYAAAGVAEYWVVDVDARRVLVHRGPGPDRYEELEIVGAVGTLVAGSLELPPLAVAELLAAAES
jgi:Uma2 family endonuclease